MCSTYQFAVSIVIGSPLTRRARTTHGWDGGGAVGRPSLFFVPRYAERGVSLLFRVPGPTEVKAEREAVFRPLRGFASPSYGSPWIRNPCPQCA